MEADEADSPYPRIPVVAAATTYVHKCGVRGWRVTRHLSMCGHHAHAFTTGVINLSPSNEQPRARPASVQVTNCLDARDQHTVLSPSLAPFSHAIHVPSGALQSLQSFLASISSFSICIYVCHAYTIRIVGPPCYTTALRHARNIRVNQLVQLRPDRGVGNITVPSCRSSDVGSTTSPPEIPVRHVRTSTQLSLLQLPFHAANSLDPPTPL